MYDATDLRIIDCLREDGRMTMKELGERVHLSGQAVSLRVQKLERDGVIRHYTIVTDEKKLGLPVHVFVHVYIQADVGHTPYLTFIEQHRRFVRNHYRVSGDACYLLEGRFETNEQLDSFLNELNAYANHKVVVVIR